MSIVFIVFLPLQAAFIAGMGNKALGKVPAKLVTIGALFISCALSWPIFLSYLVGGAEAQVVPVLTFLQSGTLDVAWALRVDTLTAVMLVVVTTVSSVVHLYSWGYMAEDPDQPRFFAYLRSEENTSELKSLMRNSSAVFCLKKKKPHISYSTSPSQTS